MCAGYCGGCLARSKALGVKDVNIQRMDTTVSECRLDELTRDGFLSSLHVYRHKIRFANSAIMFSHKLIHHVSKFGLEWPKDSDIQWLEFMCAMRWES